MKRLRFGGLGRSSRVMAGVALALLLPLTALFVGVVALGFVRGVGLPSLIMLVPALLVGLPAWNILHEWTSSLELHPGEVQARRWWRSTSLQFEDVSRRTYRGSRSRADTDATCCGALRRWS